MKSNSVLSTFVVGFLAGVIVATTGFAFLLRNSQSKAQANFGSTSTVLKLGHSLDEKHPVHRAMVFMQQRLAEKSGGTVEIQIFPNGQLGSETECIEQLQQGALAMMKTSSAPLESFVPEIALFGVPYAFRDEEHFWKVIESPIGRGLLTACEPKGLRGLCYYDAGARSFYTVKTPIMQPDDLKGLKIRVQESKTAQQMVEALGGSPMSIPFGDLYTSLQTSLVDGAENNTPSFYNNRHFEVCKHLSLDEHTRVPDVLLISTSVWSKLPRHVQLWLQEAADESAEYQRKLWADEGEQVLELVKQEGVSVHHPDQSAFSEKVKLLHESYQATPIGELLKKISEL